MNELSKLVDEYKILQNKMDEIYEQICNLTDVEVDYNDIKCIVNSFDIEDESVVIYPSDGESNLHKWGKYKTLSFNELSKLNTK